MEQLLTRYVPALRRYLLRVKRLDADRVDEATQSFVADKFLTRTLLNAANRDRGRFRNLLVRAVENYLIATYRRTRSREISDSATGEMAPAVEADPLHAFEGEWAKSVLQEAVTRTYDYCQRRGRDDLWQVLKSRVIDPAADGVRRPSYKELVRRFGFATPAHAANALLTARRIFVRKLNEVLADHALEGADVADELADLKRITSRGAKSPHFGA
jgi:hypothetical protein